MSFEKMIIQVDSDLEDLIPMFLENRNADLKKLRTELDSGNFASLASIGHDIKGVGGGYGFELMSEIGAAIEVAAEAQDTDTIAEQLNQLDDYLQHIDIQYV